MQLTNLFEYDSSVSTHSGHQPATTWVNTTIYYKYSQGAPDNGRKHHPKHVELTCNNKLIYIAHLVGYFHNCITMRGFMNIKRKFSLKRRYSYTKYDCATSQKTTLSRNNCLYELDVIRNEKDSRCDNSGLLSTCTKLQSGERAPWPSYMTVTLIQRIKKGLFVVIG
jgi:hypothetical protein